MRRRRTARRRSFLRHVGCRCCLGPGFRYSIRSASHERNTCPAAVAHRWTLPNTIGSVRLREPLPNSAEDHGRLHRVRDTHISLCNIPVG